MFVLLEILPERNGPEDIDIVLIAIISDELLPFLKGTNQDSILPEIKREGVSFPVAGNPEHFRYALKHPFLSLNPPFIRIRQVLVLLKVRWLV